METRMFTYNHSSEGTMKRHLLIIAFVMFFGLIAVNSGMAQMTDTNDLVVTATVGQSCRITAVTNIAFGSYDPTVPAGLDAAGDIRFRCVKDTGYELYITGSRSMHSNTSTDDLAFELYTDAGRSFVFPSANPSIGNSSPNNAVQITDVYGRISGLQDVREGDDYTATLTATIEY